MHAVKQIFKIFGQFYFMPHLEVIYSRNPKYGIPTTQRCFRSELEERGLKTGGSFDHGGYFNVSFEGEITPDIMEYLQVVEERDKLKINIR